MVAQRASSEAQFKNYRMNYIQQRAINGVLISYPVTSTSRASERID